MSALIKQGSADVKPAFSATSVAAPVKAAAPDPREAELNRLRKQVEQLESALAAAKKAEDDARDAGRKTGLAEAHREDTARLALLEATLAQVVGNFEARLGVLDGLAPLLARAALEKLCVPPENWVVLLEGVIARQLGALRRSSVVALFVSPEDFDQPGTAALASGRAHVEMDADLASGAARIELKLGQIDLDVQQQWKSLSALLDAMAGEGE